jgi:hypothetical protein
MPTGYTAGVADGTITDFKEYALQCARAFGACVMLRDDPLSGEIPEFEPSDYYAKQLSELETELGIFINMGPVERRSLYETEQIKRMKEKELGLASKREERARYESMLAKAKAFKSPSPDHDSYAKFIVEQLEQSIDFDCDTSYYDDQTIPSFDKWQDERLQELISGIKRARSSVKEEQEQTDSRNKWVKQLKETLGCQQ